MLLLPLVAADSVRRLSVAIVLMTNAFNKTLTTTEIERVHEEVAGFYAFYQQHGAGKVDFDFSLIQIDRRLARREIAEVSPGRYYLSRENIEAELTARGFRGRFDEVIALHAWTNANPQRALQAYGGGAVGPDGKFLGDAGFNSIPIMGRDPNTIGQVLIHEVLHNIDDMFSRSDMPDGFFNSDEMSRNMAQLLRERPGAFLPRWTDDEMLAYAERERQGREAYPWAMQLVYYGWMLERTPREAWDRLRYGRMVPAAVPAVRPLYSAIYTSAANEAFYLPVLAPPGTRVTAERRELAPRAYAQADFDGATISSGTFLAGWLPTAGRRDTSVVVIGAAGTMVVRQHVASIAAPAEVVQYLEDGPPAAIVPPVLEDRCCGDGPALAAAQLTSSSTASAQHPPPGTHAIAYGASAPGYYIHPATTQLTIRRSWRITDDGPIVVSLGAPATIVAEVREDRGRDDVRVSASLLGRDIPLRRFGDGRYSATVEDELPFGLHWVLLRAALPDGRTALDSVRLYVRPAGWIRVGNVFFREPDGRVWADAVVQGRMGDEIRRSRLPLVGIVADHVVPLAWDSAANRYEAFLFAPPEADRVVVTSLLGDFQRRVVPLMDGRNDVTARPAAAAPVPPYAGAIRLTRPPVIDGDLADWPATQAQPVAIGRPSFLLTDSASYHGDRDLSATIRFAWDDSTLYVAGEITDDSITSGDSWDTERVNLVFDMKDDTSPVTYGTPNPTLDQWQEDDYWIFWRYGGRAVRRYGKTNLDPVPGAELATRRTTAGWSFEVAIPRRALPGFVPFVGQVAGMQVFVTDGDGEASATELMWTAKWPYTADGIAWRLAELGHLVFTDAVIR